MMSNKTKLPTQPYKGVRDFYPQDMAIQQYIFDVWSATAVSFGFERYDTSVLEPSALYKAKGAENEELVNEQTYSFTDRGDREVTLRPEMTPSVARMIANKRRELSFPVRWYSIPNLFRYERMQKGRLREHWQLNCDIFGTDDYTADVELIALANQIMLNFGATPNIYTIHINDRTLMTRLYRALNVPDAIIPQITHLNDRRRKISSEEYRDALTEITNSETLSEKIIAMLDNSDEQTDVVTALAQLGITNVVFDKSLARGFDYYTGTIFEIFELDKNGNQTGRALLGGGRYDNLTELFNTESVPGVGFGMGDVTMRDFLENNDLLTSNITAPELMILPTDQALNLSAQQVAQQFRLGGLSVAVDMGSKKLSKKLAAAAEAFVQYALVLGENEQDAGIYTVKNLAEETELSGTLPELIAKLTQ